MDRAQMTIFEVAEPWAKPRLPGVDERINERLQEASDRLGTAKWFTGSFSAGDLLMVSVLRIIAGEGLVEAYQLPLLSKSDLACRLATSVRTIEGWLASGMPTRNVFSNVRIAPVDAETWLIHTLGLPETSAAVLKGLLRE